jgi:hypothetical protein
VTQRRSLSDSVLRSAIRYVLAPLQTNRLPEVNSSLNRAPELPENPLVQGFPATYGPCSSEDGPF